MMKKIMLILMSAILMFQLYVPIDKAFAQSQGNGSILSASIASMQPLLIKTPLALVLGIIVVTMYFMIAKSVSRKRHRYDGIWEIQEL
jgi:hypothetical protein